MVSPPKPWERNGSVAAAASAAPATPVATTPASAPAPATSVPATATAATASSSSSAAPTVPARPASFAATQNQTALTSPTTAAYSSPYNRLGVGYSPYQSSMYGGGMGMGYGSYGSSYGGYGSMAGGMYPGSYGMGMGMGGMGMYGAAAGQPPFGPGNPSVTQTLESTTQHTFALLQSIVQTFSGLAQMLESTFMATHSSFFALAGVLDQFAQLRSALGGVLGLFGLVRWLRDLLAGRASNNPLRADFGDFVAGRPVAPSHAPGGGAPAPRASRKPAIIFFLAILGIPYAMHRLIRLLASRAVLPPTAEQQQLGPLDPSQLTFARARHAFAAGSPAELALAENEIVAVMGKLHPATGQECDPRVEVEAEWWKGRTREGREGWFPRQFVEVLERRTPVQQKAVEMPQPQQPPEAKKVD